MNRNFGSIDQRKLASRFRVFCQSFEAVFVSTHPTRTTRSELRCRKANQALSI